MKLFGDLHFVKLNYHGYGKKNNHRCQMSKFPLMQVISESTKNHRPTEINESTVSILFLNKTTSHLLTPVEAK